LLYKSKITQVRASVEVYFRLNNCLRSFPWVETSLPTSERWPLSWRWLGTLSRNVRNNTYKVIRNIDFHWRCWPQSATVIHLSWRGEPKGVNNTHASLYSRQDWVVTQFERRLTNEIWQRHRPRDGCHRKMRCLSRDVAVTVLPEAKTCMTETKLATTFARKSELTFNRLFTSSS
jgi:hypothetical protein